jgi:hypothetical protein
VCCDVLVLSMTGQRRHPLFRPTFPICAGNGVWRRSLGARRRKDCRLFDNRTVWSTQEKNGRQKFSLSPAKTYYEGDSLFSFIGLLLV